MDERKHYAPSFRRLRSIRNQLERDIYIRTEIIEGVSIKDAPDRWNQTASYHAENERDQETIDEIDYILDRHRAQAPVWSSGAHFVLVAFAVVVMVLGTMAFARAF